LKQPESICYERLGNMALHKTLDYAFAEACYRDAVASDPENLTGQWNIGTALEAAGRPQAALTEYEQALARYEKRGHPMPELRQKVVGLRLRMQTSTSQGTVSSAPHAGT
jgi:tetratricopeptide (TPR) repeat protein